MKNFKTISNNQYSVHKKYFKPRPKFKITQNHYNHNLIKFRKLFFYLIYIVSLIILFSTLYKTYG